MKALCPMVVRVAGRASLARELHEKKAASPMEWRAAGKVTSTSEEHP